jgi:alkylation response protein AidB-like acyl-CoA dehydrogenase
MSSTQHGPQGSTRWRSYVPDELTGQLRAFCRDVVEPAAAEIDRADLYPTDLVRACAEHGWNAITLPTELGGEGGSMRRQLAVFEELSAGSAALGISLITIFQTQRIIDRFGQQALREELLPKYKGGLRTSYALTESAHGSDIRSLDTKATQQGDGWRIVGEKAFITSGSAADVYVVLAETPVGVSTFAVPRDTDGVSTYISSGATTFGLRNGPHVNLVLDDVDLPGHALIGDEGAGLRQAMQTLAASRVLAAGISIGIARAAFDTALAWASDREAFGAKVSSFQGIQWYFADAYSRLAAARALAYQAADDLDANFEVARESSNAKLIASKLATDVASMAVQVCGAHGTRVSAPLERYLRDAKAYEIAGGSSEILKNTIAKSLLAG